MITTVTLNPCIDYTISLPQLAVGELNLATDTRTDVSGKGVNVSVVLRELGQKTMATGFSYQDNHALLEKHLWQYNIPHDFVLLPGNIRMNVKVMEEDGGFTELNSLGNPVQEMAYQKLSDILERLAGESQIVVFSGRIPKGAPASIYRSFLKHIRNFSCKKVLDTGGDSLVQGLEQAPTLIKPNELEFQQLTGLYPKDIHQTGKASRQLIEEKKLEYICVSLGSRGAILSDKESSYYAPRMEVEARGATGAGDSMVAGLCGALANHLSTPDMLRHGVAAATATVLREGTLLAQKPMFDQLLPQVKIEKI